MIKDIEKTLDIIIEKVQKRTNVAVIGMSGGVDSTVVATICSIALGPKNVIGVELPASSYDLLTEGKHNDNSTKIIKKLKIKKIMYNIENSVLTFKKDFYEAIKAPLNIINEGNIKARMRMMALYSIAHEIQNITKRVVRVVGTNNISEDFIGHCTKGGDAISDFSPIGDLFKSEIYQLADYFVEKEILEENMIDRTPSSGLWESQNDLDELGYSYDEMEEVITRIFNIKEQMFETKTALDAFILNKHLENQHKQNVTENFILRNIDGLFKEK